jgi:hypothetical protein
LFRLKPFVFFVNFFGALYYAFFHLPQAKKEVVEQTYFGTSVVNDFPTTPSQTIPVNYECNPLKFNFPTGQVVQSKGDDTLGGVTYG